MTAYFPNIIFGWIYFLLLISLLTVCSYIDTRTMKIPKWLAITILGVGLLANLVRGVWLGATGSQTWILPAGSPWIGLADGLLFSITGFLLGFSLFFFLWILGVSGGGDVKLFTALGTWIGPLLVLKVFMGTLVVVGFIVMLRMAYFLFSGKGFQAMRNKVARKDKAAKKRKRGDLGFSLPLAIAAFVVLLWSYRVDLQLSKPKLSNKNDINNARAELTPKQ